MRLDHIIVLIHWIKLLSPPVFITGHTFLFPFVRNWSFQWSEILKALFHPGNSVTAFSERFDEPYYSLFIMPGGHSGEVIPVPIPNTEVKLSYADDTAAKWESR